MEEKKEVNNQEAQPETKGVEDKGSQAPENTGIDYKAELERLTLERDNYKTGMLNAKDLLKKSREKKTEDEDKEEEDDIESKINAIVESKVSAIKSDLEKSTVDSLIGEYSNDADEQALIKYHLENSVAQSGSLRDRIENAKLIANKSALTKERDELAFALKAKSGVSRSSTASGGNQDVEKGKKEIFSPEVIEAIKKRGLDPEKVKETYLKLQNK